MCGPITLLLASAALTGGSLFAGNQAQKRVEKAQNKVRFAERERQEQHQRDAQDIFDITLKDSGAEDQKTKLAELQQEKGDEARRRVKVSTDDDFLPGQSKTNNVIRRSTQNTLQGGDVERKRRAQLAAILDSYADIRTSRDIGQRQSGESLGQITDFARGSSRVAEQEIANAANKGGGFFSVLSPILGGLGMAAGSAGFSGLSPLPTGSGTAIKNPNIPGTKFLID